MISTITDKNNEKQEITVIRANNDTNGNPRFLVHFLSLDMTSEQYNDDKARRKLLQSINCKKYNYKSFRGGLIFQSYNFNLSEDLQDAYNKINNGGF